MFTGINIPFIDARRQLTPLREASPAWDRLTFFHDALAQVLGVAVFNADVLACSVWLAPLWVHLYRIRRS